MTEFAIAAGSRVSHYRFEAQIGAGGMGEVYSAVDLTLERRVALKILPPALLHDVERVRRFVQEAKSASALNHPNIVTIYEIGQGEVVSDDPQAASQTVHYIAMEFIEGRTLRALVKDRTPLSELLPLLAQAADGLQKAHAAGLVHRDLKPDNVMVTADGFAKVVDFGLAKLTDEAQEQRGASNDPKLTGQGIVVGTLGYMAPEQIEGKPVRSAADVFAFGCMLYECVAGRRPFEADLAIDTMHRIVFSEPLPLPSVRPDVPPELANLVDACLRKKPEERIGSMREVASVLRTLSPGAPASFPAAIAEARPITPPGGTVATPRSGAVPQLHGGSSPTHRAAAAAASSPSLRRRPNVIVRSVAFAYRSFLVVIVGTAIYLFATMPDVGAAASHARDLPSWTSLDHVSAAGRRSVVAATDPEFYRRRALDLKEPKELARAMMKDDRSRYLPSPIAKRAAAQLFPMSRFNPLRPVREWAIAAQMQRELGSRKILELYVNVAPFGDATGIAEASKKYFGKSAGRLNRDEAAMLSTLSVSERFDPSAPPPEVVAVKASVLEKMASVVER